MTIEPTKTTIRVITRDSMNNGPSTFAVTDHRNDLIGASKHFGEVAMLHIETWMVDEWETIILHHYCNDKNGKLPRAMWGM